MSSELLNKVRVYKDFLEGCSHSSFDGVMFCKVSGVTYDGKQEVLKQVAQDTPIKLERERRNEFDFYAVKVMAYVDLEWQSVGYVPASINKEIATTLDTGLQLRARVWKKSGGEGEFFYGLTITITKGS